MKRTISKGGRNSASRALLVWVAVAWTAAASGAAGNLLTNPGFESGMSGWDPNNGWFGSSAAAVVAGEGRAGSQGLRLDGNGSRGIVIQNQAVSPGDYTLGGWVKCSNVGSTRVAIQVEWLDASWGWVGNQGVGHITGSTDWTYIEGTVTAPGNAAYVLVEAVTWDPASLTVGITLLYLYCETGVIPADTMPRMAVNSTLGSAMVWSLENGQNYRVAARAGNADGDLSARGPEVAATVSDRQAPRPGWLQAQWETDGRVRIGWSPHVLDADIATARFRTPGGGFRCGQRPALGRRDEALLLHGAVGQSRHERAGRHDADRRAV